MMELPNIWIYDVGTINNHVFIGTLEEAKSAIKDYFLALRDGDGRALIDEAEVTWLWDESDDRDAKYILCIRGQVGVFATLQQATTVLKGRADDAHTMDSHYKQQDDTPLISKSDVFEMLCDVLNSDSETDALQRVKDLHNEFKPFKASEARGDDDLPKTMKLIWMDKEDWGWKSIVSAFTTRQAVEHLQAIIDKEYPITCPKLLAVSEGRVLYQAHFEDYVVGQIELEKNDG